MQLFTMKCSCPYMEYSSVSTWHMWLILPTLPLESHTLLVIPLIQLSCKHPCPWSITSLSFQYFHILYSPHSLDPWFQLEADSPHGSICISLVLLSAVTLVFLAIPTYWSTFSPSSFGNECVQRLPLATHTQSHFFIPNNAASSPRMPPLVPNLGKSGKRQCHWIWS